METSVRNFIAYSSLAACGPIDFFWQVGCHDAVWVDHVHQGKQNSFYSQYYKNLVQNAFCA